MNCDYFRTQAVSNYADIEVVISHVTMNVDD